MTTHEDTVCIRWLGKQEYKSTWLAMQDFTRSRTDETPDEIWLLEHPPVFTQGQNGKPEHVLNPGDIPIVETDRGGQVTYHGPGQLMIYTLIDVKRKKMNVREFVTRLEQSIVDYLQSHGAHAQARRDAPGVYIDGKKIASVGLRIRKGCSYHGIAFNISMDLSPFQRINPCGFANLNMTQLINESKNAFAGDVKDAGEEYVNYLVEQLGYTVANNKVRQTCQTQNSAA
jgi:lipoyl(octanoyl) transferase